MSENRYTLEQLLELAHKHRALHIKVGPLEIQLAPDAFAQAPIQGDLENLPDAFKKMPTPEEFQFMHSPLTPEEDEQEGKA